VKRSASSKFQSRQDWHLRRKHTARREAGRSAGDAADQGRIRHRGTAVTRLALVGCSEPEVATITGHSLRDVRSILDANYLHRDPALGETAIRKLERGTVFPTRQKNG
jgi:hypothetical protein